MPHRQARFQAELSQVIRAVDRQGTAGPLFTAEADIPPVGQADLFGKMRQQHHPSDRRGQGGDQKSMVTAGDNACHGSRGVSADAIGNQPFSRQERFQSGHLGFAPGHFSNKFSHMRLSWRQAVGLAVLSAGSNCLSRLRSSRGLPSDREPSPGLSAPESSSSRRFPADESRNRRRRDLRSTTATASNIRPAGPTAVPAPD